ncbi:hypothetical protein JX265_003996 [Neoarthrinium moseri]|uniref:Uncharacterized protein n=1 Tax=Neoarthrinium moseri TaxID=1658444 RepID=A0A9Q0AP04_9PEZI|nr:uncharacterized protein JN550_006749 [Neoarthrinium moseri]KAI1867942.1 hypothetical protein JN550_006749 [Neoarthrinium moseri]KAI1876470.1 hypothetical protein JX265_003996 [Neoarthrinium moseri]
MPAVCQQPFEVSTTEVPGGRTPRLLQCPSSEPTYRYLHYFDLFVRKNTFNTWYPSYDTDIRKLLGTEPESPLVQAVLAVGALESSKSSATSPIDVSYHRSDSRYALMSYSGSMAALRDAINLPGVPSRIQVLWTTLLLGLFELMHDSTGSGWVKHMVHGTSRAMEAAGPVLFRSGLGRGFFLQARMFEVCRAVVFNESTFLTTPGWVALSSESWTGNGSWEWSPLDGLLDAISMCSKLCVQSGNLLDNLDQLGAVKVSELANDLALEGHRLRHTLEMWRVMNSEILDTAMNLGACVGSSRIVDHTGLLANAFFAAISIYLSGVYDYSITLWRNWDILVPTLSKEDVQCHVHTILSSVSLAMERTNISHLLYLFPLRVAGARCVDDWQRNQVRTLLRRVGTNFVVARAFETELNMLWGHK